MSRDPLSASYPWNSTYAFAENNPIRFIDLEGLEKANPKDFVDAIAFLSNFVAEITANPSCNESAIKGLDMADVVLELAAQVKLASNNDFSPAKTNYLGYFCGKSAAQNDIIMYNPKGYVEFMIELFLEGKAQFGGDGMVIEIPDELLESEGIPTKSFVPIVDEVYGKSLDAATKKKENKNETRKKVGRFLFSEGNTIPHEYEALLEATGLMVSEGKFYEDFNKEDVVNLECAVKEGLLPIVFENHGITLGDPDPGLQGKYGIHFVTIHNLKILPGDKVEFQYWDYGKLSKKNTLTIEEFTDGMKGYWITKKEQ